MKTIEKNKVSIIIPVYNCEKYIKKCINSVKKQSYKNIEVLIINDGSTDKTEKICMNIIKKDKRFKLINQPNRGVSFSRNVGISKSTGKYLQFTDADDWLASDMIELMVKKIEEENADMVISEYYNYYQKNKSLESVPLKNFDNKTFKDIISDESTLYGGFPWNKLFKKDIVKVYYDENVHYYENLLFFLENSENVKKYSVIHKPLYFYNINDDSAVHSNKYNQKKISILSALNRIIEIVSYEYKDLYKYLFISKYHYNYFNYKKNKFDMNVFKEYQKYEKKYYKEIKKNNNLTTKNRIKLFIIKKIPFIYKIAKK